MKRIISFLSFFFLHIIIIAQTGTIRGMIYDEVLEPAMGASVIVKNSSFYGVSDFNGVFIIPNLPFGDYVLEVSYIGYATQNINFSVESKNSDLIKIFLKESATQLDDIKINVERQERKNDVSVSVVKLTSKTINKLPSIGGEPDVAQFLQILPGVVFTGDQGGQLYIRGGAPIHNKVLLDGMTIYSPFHSIGFFSVFDTDLIKKADVYTGGFGAEYGGRISSIMDIQTRDGNKKKLSSKLSANTFASKLLIEGPIFKYQDRGTSGSFIFSGKKSYLNQTSKSIYNYIDTTGVGLPYKFSDFYGKLSFSSPNGSKVNIYGFNFNDNVNYIDVTEMGWLTYGFGTNILLVPASAKMLVEGKLSYSKYDVSQQDFEQPLNTSSIGGYNIGLNFSYFVSQEHKFKYGAEILGQSTLLEFRNSIGTLVTSDDNYDVFSGYVDYKYNNTRLIINPGLRIQSYTSMGEVSLEPRLGVKYNLNEKFRIKASCGIFSQNLLSTSSERDVVNLFSGFLSSPNSLPSDFQGNEVQSYLQKSKHYIFGFEYDVNDYLDFNIEGYVKNFSQLIAENKNRLFPDNLDSQDEPDYLKKAFIVESGLASGFDVLLKYANDRLNIWSVYSFGIVERQDEIQVYYPHYDRRHNFNFLCSYLFGHKKDFEFSIRWNYGSGFPFMKTQGYYEQLNLNNGLNTDFNTQNGDLGVIYSGLASGRLPSYHRLDMSLKKSHNIFQTATLEWSIGVTNIYNRENIFYYNRVAAQRVNQLPILPSLGLKFIF